MAKLITKEQMAEQESYIMKLKEENMRYAARKISAYRNIRLSAE